jgi:inorganic pyrophosphatase
LPSNLVERLTHYFATYKLMPGDDTSNVRIAKTYGWDHAEKVVRAAMRDYSDEYGD